MLKVNEVFGPTIQGEGRSVGKEVFFVRLSGCNLHCVWCDTPYTWNWIGTPFAHPEKYDPAAEVHEMTAPMIYAKLLGLRVGTNAKALVISGGEPLVQQKQLVSFVEMMKDCGWWVEVETNGTITPLPALQRMVDQFNCSPKLSNSGDPQQLRERPKALYFLARMTNVYFKFVVMTEQDVDEVLDLVERYEMHPERVYLMPEGRTPDQLERTRDTTQTLASKFGFQFSDRLHVTQFGGVRGV